MGFFGLNYQSLNVIATVALYVFRKLQKTENYFFQNSFPTPCVYYLFSQNLSQFTEGEKQFSVDKSSIRLHCV